MKNKTFLFELDVYERHEEGEKKRELIKAPDLVTAFAQSKLAKQSLEEHSLEPEDGDYPKTKKAIMEFVDSIDIGGWSWLRISEMAGKKMVKVNKLKKICG